MGADGKWHSSVVPAGVAEVVLQALGSLRTDDPALIVEEREDGAVRATITERPGFAPALRASVVSKFPAVEAVIADATGTPPAPGLFPVVFCSPSKTRLSLLWTSTKELEEQMAAWGRRMGGGDA